MLPGNFFVGFVLFASPVVALIIMSRWRPQVAVPVLLLWSTMFMPSNAAYDPPILPPLDKQIVPGLFALIGCVMFRKSALKRSRPFRGYDVLILVMLVSTAVTVLTNREPIAIGRVRLPGLSMQDLVSEVMLNFLIWWPAFYLGRNLYKTSADFQQLFVTVAVAGLVYAPLCLIEIRFSPQLNQWIYGYYQHDFIQTIRGTGFRPMVFMGNGLRVALFMVMTILAAAGLALTKTRIRKLNPKAVTLFLLVTLLLCKSAGAAMFAFIGLVLLWFTNPRLQMRVAAILAILAALYPLFRIWNILPVEGIISFFTSLVGEERAGSLAFRLRNEALLLDHGLDKLWFGWGGYGRHLVYDPGVDGMSGVPDGFWIGVVGSKGLVGYICCFGVIVLPLLRARRVLSKMTDKKDRILAACLALMLVFFAVDQIPNATVDPYLLFLVGVFSSLTRGLQPAEPPPPARYETAGWPPVPTEPGPATQPLL